MLATNLATGRHAPSVLPGTAPCVSQFWGLERALARLRSGPNFGVFCMHTRLAMRCLITGLVLAVPFAAEGQTLEELPPRKPGHWEIRIVTEKPAGAPAVVSRVCIDPSTDREIMEFGLRMSRKGCKRYEMKREGKTLVIDAECKLGPIKSVTHTTLSGDFQSRYTVRIEGTTDGGFLGGGKGPQETLMTQTARWNGAACPAGMVPGDIDMGNGMKFNVKQLKGLQKILPQLQLK